METVPRVQFGRLLEQIRTRKPRISRERLEELANVSRNEIYRLEKGMELNPREDTYKGIRGGLATSRTQEELGALDAAWTAAFELPLPVSGVATTGDRARGDGVEHGVRPLDSSGGERAAHQDANANAPHLPPASPASAPAVLPGTGQGHAAKDQCAGGGEVGNLQQATSVDWKRVNRRVTLGPITVVNNSAVVMQPSGCHPASSATSTCHVGDSNRDGSSGTSDTNGDDNDSDTADNADHADDPRHTHLGRGASASRQHRFPARWRFSRWVAAVGVCATVCALLLAAPRLSIVARSSDLLGALATAFGHPAASDRTPTVTPCSGQHGTLTLDDWLPIEIPYGQADGHHCEIALRNGRTGVQVTILVPDATRRYVSYRDPIWSSTTHQLFYVAVTTDEQDDLWYTPLRENSLGAPPAVVGPQKLFRGCGSRCISMALSQVG